jgi:hypothetical protein
MSELDFQKFYSIFVSPLDHHHEIYFIKSFADLCMGWKQETFKQVIIQVTKKNTVPLPMVFNSPSQMCMLSNKQEAVQQLFKHLDFKKLGRVDAF